MTTKEDNMETVGSVGRMMSTDEWYERSGRHYDELRQAMISRPLSVDELREVGQIGYRMLCPINQSFTASVKIAEFASLLSVQQMIQLAASRESK